MVPCLRNRALVFIAGMTLCEGVLAHSPIKGLDSFYAGLLHPLFVPAHLVALLAFGLLAGQQRTGSPLPLILTFLIAVIIGLVLTGLQPGHDVAVVLLAVAASTGVLVAIARPLPSWFRLGLAIAIGGLLGVDSAQPELAGRARFAALLGSGIALYLLMLYALVFADLSQRRDWQRIAVRIVGSWTAAAAFLVFALTVSRVS